MKIFSANLDWADEGYIYCLSITTENKIKALDALIRKLNGLEILEEYLSVYWANDEYFEFTIPEILNYLTWAVNISEEEYAILQKFRVTGFDFYKELQEYILMICSLERNVVKYSQKDLKEIKSYYVELGGSLNYLETKFKRLHGQNSN